MISLLKELVIHFGDFVLTKLLIFSGIKPLVVYVLEDIGLFLSKEERKKSLIFVLDNQKQ
jgi:hypothetical protein